VASFVRFVSWLADRAPASEPLCAYGQKISQKNTWNLNLIDHMDEMVTHAMSVTSEGGTNFTVASGTIEAGVKIYSSRVDSVHTEVYKVLGNLSRANDRGGNAQ
jgi:condensin complex subunit 2